MLQAIACFLCFLAILVLAFIVACHFLWGVVLLLAAALCSVCMHACVDSVLLCDCETAECCAAWLWGGLAACWQPRRLGKGGGKGPRGGGEAGRQQRGGTCRSVSQETPAVAADLDSRARGSWPSAQMWPAAARGSMGSSAAGNQQQSVGARRGWAAPQAQGRAGSCSPGGRRVVLSSQKIMQSTWLSTLSCHAACNTDGSPLPPVPPAGAGEHRLRC